MLYVRFYYDGDVSQVIFEEWELALSETVAGFGAGYAWDVGIEKLPYPAKVPPRGRLAY